MSLRQLITKARWAVNYGGQPAYMSVMGGMANGANTATFGADSGRFVMPIGGTFKNVFVRSNPGSNGLVPPTFTLTLQVNGVDTALSVTVNSGTATGFNYTNTVSVNALDDVIWKVDGSRQIFEGYDLFVAVEFDPANNVSSIYGCSPGGDRTLGNYTFGGALGNGVISEGFIPGASGYSNTMSIAATAGNITKMVAKTYAAAPGVGNAWNIVLRKNGVIQDGTGGTVNTLTQVAGTNTTGSATFTLPVAVGDIIEFVVYVSGASLPYAIVPGVAVGIEFQATTTFRYMMCGGDNQTLSTSGFIWTENQQLSAGELRAMSPIGQPGMRLVGLYSRFDAGSGTGALNKSYTFTVRKSQVDTALTTTIAGTTTPLTSLVTGDLYFNPGDYIDIGYSSINNPTVGEYHWGLELRSDFSVNAPNTGIYKLVPGRTNDQLYVTFNPNTTQNTAIPNPFATGYLAGDE